MKLFLALLAPSLSFHVLARSSEHFPQRPDAHEIVHVHDHRLTVHGYSTDDARLHTAHPNVKTRTRVVVTTVYEGVITTVTITDLNSPHGTTTTSLLLPVVTTSPTNPSSTLDFMLQFTTITLLYSGMVAFTETIATPSSPGRIGTIIVREPQQFSTIVSFYTESTITTLTIAIPTLPGQLGTVLIELPQQIQSFTTATGSSSSAGSTSTLIMIPTPGSMSGSSAIDSSNGTLQTSPLSSSVSATPVVSSGLPLASTPDLSSAPLSFSPAPTPASSFSVQVIPVSSSPPVACAIQTPGAYGTCLTTLPQACQDLMSPVLSGAVLNQADLLSCQTALGVAGTVNAAECFAGNDLNTLTGSYVSTCLQGHLCRPCVTTLPASCTSSDPNILSTVACQAALGVAATGYAAYCFDSIRPDTEEFADCIQQRVPICPINPTPPENPCVSSSIPPTPSLSPACISSLPPACQLSSNPSPISLVVSADGLCGSTNGQGCIGSVFGACCSEYGFCGSDDIYCGPGCQPDAGLCAQVPIIINDCFTALEAIVGAMATTVRATCVTTDITQTTDQSFVTCLNNNLPFCEIVTKR